MRWGAPFTVGVALYLNAYAESEEGVDVEVDNKVQRPGCAFRMLALLAATSLIPAVTL